MQYGFVESLVGTRFLTYGSTVAPSDDDVRGT